MPLAIAPPAITSQKLVVLTLSRQRYAERTEAGHRLVKLTRRRWVGSRPGNAELMPGDGTRIRPRGAARLLSRLFSLGSRFWVLSELDALTCSLLAGDQRICALASLRLARGRRMRRGEDEVGPIHFQVGHSSRQRITNSPRPRS